LGRGESSDALALYGVAVGLAGDGGRLPIEQMSAMDSHGEWTALESVAVIDYPWRVARSARRLVAEREESLSLSVGGYLVAVPVSASRFAAEKSVSYDS
jgi:hypothetical protein